MIFPQFENWDRSADAGDHVFALRVHQKLAVELLRSGGRIAGEAHARAAGVAEIAEDHGLHVDGGAQHVVDVVDATVVLGTIVLPGAEHGVARHDELLVRVLGKVAFGVLLDDLLVFVDHFLQRLGVEVGVELGFLLLLLGVEDLVERGFRDVQHHVAEHLDQAAVGIGGEARIVAAFRQGLDTLIVEAEIQDGVHHAGHGELRAGAHAYQQRVLALAELLALQFLQAFKRGIRLLVDFGGDGIGAHVLAARLGLDGKARRHGEIGVGHLGEASALAPKIILHLAVAIGFATAEEVDVLRGWLLFCGLEAGFGESLRRHNSC